MGKSKKKEKKKSTKKEKYAKFRKDKPASMDVSMPDLSSEQMLQKKKDEERIDKFLRYSRNRPILNLREKKLKKGN